MAQPARRPHLHAGPRARRPTSRPPSRPAPAAAAAAASQAARPRGGRGGAGRDSRSSSPHAGSPLRRSPPRAAVRSRLALIYSRVQPAPPRPRWRRGAGPAARGSWAGLAGEARANPTGGGAPGCSMACCPPPPPITSGGVYRSSGASKLVMEISAQLHLTRSTSSLTQLCKLPNPGLAK